MEHATLYRMLNAKHICPFGTKAKHLLESRGYEVEDHLLRTREETDAFKAQHNVKTTPQTFIDGQRIGGYDDLRAHFGLAPAKREKTYAPVISLFAVALLIALALQWNGAGSALLNLRTLAIFAGLSTCLLALQKLRDLESFTNGFLNYDLLALRYVPYSYAYPYLELAAGLGMLSGTLPNLSAAIALFTGVEGAASTIKAVYLDHRELKCACVGGDSKVPLGFISLLENFLMIAMGLWMAVGMPGT